MFILRDITCVHFSSIHISTLLFIKLLSFTFRVCHSLFSVVLTLLAVYVNIPRTKDWVPSLSVSNWHEYKSEWSICQNTEFILGPFAIDFTNIFSKSVWGEQDGMNASLVT